MPKYYRFRATTPTRKPRRKEKEAKHIERSRTETGKSWLDLSISCSPAASWYLRRTAWRDPLRPRWSGLVSLRPSLQLNNRPIFVFKIPTAN